MSNHPPGPPTERMHKPANDEPAEKRELRLKLLEMIKRKEAIRREKPR